MNTVLTVLVPLVKRSEGCRLRAYQDTGGVWTIGYGHTSGVSEGMEISNAQAEQLLLLDAQDAVINTLLILPTLATMPAACIAAVSDFAFNLGPGQLRSSTLRRRIQHEEFDDVPYQLRRWVYDNGRKLPGLILRREAEVALWEQGRLEQKRSTAGSRV